MVSQLNFSESIKTETRCPLFKFFWISNILNISIVNYQSTTTRGDLDSGITQMSTEAWGIIMF